MDKNLADKPEYATVKATIFHIKTDSDPWYQCCPTPDCNKKVSENMGQYHCEKCNNSFPNVGFLLAPLFLIDLYFLFFYFSLVYLSFYFECQYQ